MDIRTFCKRFMLWAAVAVAVIMLICGLCFGKVIEANIYEEVGKWVVMTLFIIVVVEVICYTMSQFFYHGSKWDPTSAKYRNAKKEFLPVKFNFFDNALKIYGSHAVPKYLFREALESIKAVSEESALWGARSVDSLCHEWATHNLAYALGIKRERTEDVDLNIVQKWYEKFAYAVVGTIATAVIK